MKIRLKPGKIALLAVVALVIAAGMYVGLINPTVLRSRAELAVGNVAGAASGALASQTDDSAEIDPRCVEAVRGELRRIEAAKKKVQSGQRFATGGVTWAAVNAELGGAPSAPCAGRFELGTTEQLPWFVTSDGRRITLRSY